VGAADALAKRIGLPFENLDLLRQALIHSSYTSDHPALPAASNQRLEFLGDAVVALAFSDELFRQHPDDDEGSMTARRAALVSTPGLARLAERIGLSDYVVLGEGAERAGERHRPSVLEAAFEAVVGAIHVTFGFERTRDWLIELAAPELSEPRSIDSLKSPKSRLLESAQALTGKPPTYRVVSMSGPDHAREYIVEALVGGSVMGTGAGSNRRAAEQVAAAAALEQMGVE
jgi:ribonuclease-3